MVELDLPGALVTSDGRTVLNPRYVERVQMDERWQGDGEAQFRVLAYTNDDDRGCFPLTSWTGEADALSVLRYAGSVISLA